MRPFDLPRRPLIVALAAGASLLLVGATTAAAELLRGSLAAQGESLTFTLDGDSREDVVGGEIRIGDTRFTIERVSRLGLIGARGAAGKRFAVFSSSFSEQTANGEPWVAAGDYLGCDSDYNSFLAVYDVTNDTKRAALGPVPYPTLTESVEHSDKGVVYCFMSRPPG